MCDCSTDACCSICAVLVPVADTLSLMLCSLLLLLSLLLLQLIQQQLQRAQDSGWVRATKSGVSLLELVSDHVEKGPFTYAVCLNL
jgi:hypothetical protein